MHKKSAGTALLAGLIIMQILPCSVKGMFLHEAPKLPAISTAAIVTVEIFRISSFIFIASTPFFGFRFLRRLSRL